MIYTIDLTTKGATPLEYLDLAGVDSVSIETSMLVGGTTFNAGVLEVKKTNCINGVPASFGTPQTISAPGFAEVNATDFAKAAYLVLECTTAASSATVVRVKVRMTQLGFKID